MKLKTIKHGFWKAIFYTLMIKYTPADGIIGTQVCDSRTVKSLNINYQLLTDPKEDY